MTSEPPTKYRLVPSAPEQIECWVCHSWLKHYYSS